MEQYMWYILVGGSAFVWALTAMTKAVKTDRPSNKPKSEGLLGEGSIKYPGHIAYATANDYYPGCYAAVFSSVSDFNSYFAPGKAGFLGLVVDVKLFPDNRILCMFTKKLTADDQADVEEWSRSQHEFFQAKRTKRMMDEAEEGEKKVKAQQESKHFEEIGRKYSARNAHVKSLQPGSTERKAAEAKLQSGDLSE